jgi:predicted Rossmann fold flavoprotein
MQAASVLNSLMTEINESGIRICINTPVTGISKDKAGFILRSGDQNFSADKVIVSTGLGSGGFAIPGFEASGLFSCIEDLSFKKLLPALCGLKVSEDISSVAGVRARGEVSLYSGNEFLGSDEGEIQFTKDCISGIPVFQVSRQASVYLDQSRSVTASVDLCPEISEEDLKLLLTDRIRRHPGRKIYEIFNGVINEKLLKFVYLKAGISGRDKVLDIPEEKKNTFIETLKNLRFEIIGTEKSEKAQTMRGGIELININEDCELKRAPGLYVTGELLDIDGKCGGYNLWLAWATGIAAGRSVAK